MSSTMDIHDKTAVQNSMKEYYGKVLGGTGDIKTEVCYMSKRRTSQQVKEVLGLVHENVKARYYGCGTVAPDCIEGKCVLDVGSGSGQDCYVLSKLVGERGSVVGLDMTDELVEAAEKYIPFHTKKYGFTKPNVRFVKGYIENMAEAGLTDNLFDIIISNCVVNLCHDKASVLKEVYRVLKVGGEFYFSDLYTDRDLPEEVRANKVFWGEGAGALYWEDLAKLATKAGFSHPLAVSAFRYNVRNEEMKQSLGDARFVSVTYRLFKLPQALEPACEVVYDGSVSGCGKELVLDHHHTFTTGEAVAVSPMIATVLKTSRFREAFTFGPAEVPCCDQMCEKNPFKIADKLD